MAPYSTKSGSKAAAYGEKREGKEDVERGTGGKVDVEREKEKRDGERYYRTTSFRAVPSGRVTMLMPSVGWSILMPSMV
jgi:hypothetical protein